MKDTEFTGNYYTIGDIVQFTDLTDRTIRNYIAYGILQCEKINGIWHFTPEQVDSFIRNPNVRPSIQSKKNAIVYDFMLDKKKREHQICIILDLPGDNPKKVAEFFCFSITTGNYHDIRFSFDSLAGDPRIILKGLSKDVLILVQKYYSKQQQL